MVTYLSSPKYTIKCWTSRSPPRPGDQDVCPSRSRQPLREPRWPFRRSVRTAPGLYISTLNTACLVFYCSNISYASRLPPSRENTTTCTDSPSPTLVVALTDTSYGMYGSVCVTNTIPAHRYPGLVHVH